MKFYELQPGDDTIHEVAQGMVALANETGEEVITEMGGFEIELTAKPGDDPKSIEDYYNQAFQEVISGDRSSFGS